MSRSSRINSLSQFAVVLLTLVLIAFASSRCASTAKRVPQHAEQSHKAMAGPGFTPYLWGESSQYEVTAPWLGDNFIEVTATRSHEVLVGSWVCIKPENTSQVRVVEETEELPEAQSVPENVPGAARLRRSF